jgi:hypothetical protein
MEAAILAAQSGRATEPGLSQAERAALSVRTPSSQYG